MDLTTLFCELDEFVKALNYTNDQLLITTGKSNRGGNPRMSLSEMMTIIVLYHSSGYIN